MNDKDAVKSEVLRLLLIGDCIEAYKYAEKFQPEGENLFVQVIRENAKELRSIGYFWTYQRTEPKYLNLLGPFY